MNLKLTQYDTDDNVIDGPTLIPTSRLSDGLVDLVHTQGVAKVAVYSDNGTYTAWERDTTDMTESDLGEAWNGSAVERAGRTIDRDNDFRALMLGPN